MTIRQVFAACVLWNAVSLAAPISATSPQAEGVYPPAPRADIPAPRTDENSRRAHSELLEKRTKGRIDVYFVGDSITRRWGATDYPGLLAHWRTTFFGWNAANFGWGADRIENVLWRLENGELDGVHPKVIVVLAGTNNVGAEPGGPDKIADITRGLQALVETCRRKAPRATIVLTAIFPRNDNMGVMPEIDRINEGLARLADGSGVRYLNVNDTLADADGRLFPGMMHEGDKLHPTLKGYQVWADGLKPILLGILGPPSAIDQAPPPTGDPSARPPIDLQAPPQAGLQQQVRAWRQAHDIEILRELSQFVSLPNLAGDDAGIRRNATHLAGLLEKRGFQARLLDSPGSPPAVFGDLRVPGAARTVMFYAHYDGQPVDPSEWLSPPWTPVLRDGIDTQGGREIAIPTTPGRLDGEWRLYGRSAADDKGPIVAMLSAIDALRTASIQPSVNLKVFFDGEEEAGSEHLRDMLQRHRDLLGADLWLFGDGPVHQSRRQQVVFGARGVLPVQFTVYGPARGLHSGHYGNWAYNPITLAANLVASMRDDEGHIRIDGFYEDVVPPSAVERAAILAAPSIDVALKEELQIGGTEGNSALIGERVMLPALNLRGIQGGGIGTVSANTIPTEATVSIDFRLVPNQSVARVQALFRSHLERQGYEVMDHVPTRDERLKHRKIARVTWEPGYRATKTSMELPGSRAVIRAAEQALGAPPVIVPLLGGSLPMHVFDEVLRAPVVILPTVNHDNNQHAANENLRLQNLWDGIELYAGVLASIGPLLEDGGQ